MLKSFFMVILCALPVFASTESTCSERFVQGEVVQATHQSKEMCLQWCSGEIEWCCHYGTKMETELTVAFELQSHEDIHALSGRLNPETQELKIRATAHAVTPACPVDVKRTVTKTLTTDFFDTGMTTVVFQEGNAC